MLKGTRGYLKGMKKLKPNFIDIKIWQFAHKLSIKIYTATKSFPKDELYSLTNQIRRAAVSIVLNIVEGTARQHDKETIQFLYQARSSLREVQAALYIAEDLKYVSTDTVEELVSEFCILEHQINKFILYRKNKTPDLLIGGTGATILCTV